MVDVFISYSRRDSVKVAMLARAITEAGYVVWWDEELPPHRSYGDVITDKIAMANAALVVWSKDSVQSEWVRAEADMARNQRKLIQTSLDEVMPPLPFNQIQYAPIGDWQGEADHSGWRKVKASLAELCGPREGGDRRPEPAPEPAPAPPAPPPQASQAVAPSASKAPLFAGIAIAGAAVIGVGAFWFGQRDARPDETAPVAVQSEAGAPAGDTGEAATPDSRFDVMATVSDPDGYTNVRATPATSGEIVGKVEVGKAFATYEQTGDWWRVRLADGRTGYVARSRIRLSGETIADVSAVGPAPAVAPEQPAAASPANPADMTFADSSTRLIAPFELAGLGPSTLKLARNEIYARKGRRFRDPWLRDHFSQFSWYQPLHDEVPLNRIEQRNVALIRQAEARYR